MTRMRQLAYGSATLFAASIWIGGTASAQEPSAGQDLTDKTVWLMPDSRLRNKPGLSPFTIYLHAKTALELKGRGRCEPAADCPVRYDNKDLWVRRTRLSLSATPATTMGTDGRPGTPPSTLIGTAPAGSDQRWLRPGETGDEVRRLQEALNAKGIRVTVDGSYGGGTEEAVRQFQRSAGLTADGVAGRQVREALAMSGGTAKPIEKIENKIEGLKEKIKEKIARLKARVAGVARPGGQPPIFRTLRNGDSGDDVRLLQEILVDHGFKVTVDGQFGGGTEEAVRQFQRRAGLNADGAVGPMTLEKLGA